VLDLFGLDCVVFGEAASRSWRSGSLGTEFVGAFGSATTGSGLGGVSLTTTGGSTGGGAETG
jgi:hypothetical protein